MDHAERIVWAIDLGTRPYGEIWSLQEELVALRQTESVPDLLLLLEHEPVVTLGKSGHQDHVLVSSQEMGHRGVSFFRVDRGGDATFHGPGQLVGYPILDLTRHGKDVHLYCRKLEEVGIRILSDYGLSGERKTGLTGVWVKEEKVMAIGVGVKRWISFHGLALNVSTDLEYFRLIHPCGIRDRGVTSLSRLLQREAPLGEVKEALLRHFSCLFEVRVEKKAEAEIFEVMHGKGKEALLAGAEGPSA
jgi:lipoate-protein ligase B